jgi:hypothetical protein
VLVLSCILLVVVSGRVCVLSGEVHCPLSFITYATFITFAIFIGIHLVGITTDHFDWS